MLCYVLCFIFFRVLESDASDETKPKVPKYCTSIYFRIQINASEIQNENSIL